MFERRLKIFLGILAVVIAALTLRAAQLQVADRAYWSQQADSGLNNVQIVQGIENSPEYHMQVVHDLFGSWLGRSLSMVRSAIMARSSG